MPLFKSSREKLLWLYVSMVLTAIAATLLFGNPLLGIFGNQNIQAALFLLGMFLIAVMVLVHAFRFRPGKTELTIWLGLAAVCVMLFLRLGLAERSHLIEYSVLAIFIQMALIERSGDSNILKPALLAFLITALVGVLDESIQYFLPSRVFDPVDIFFNGMAAFSAICASLVLRWSRKKFSKTSSPNNKT